VCVRQECCRSHWHAWLLQLCCSSVAAVARVLSLALARMVGERTGSHAHACLYQPQHACTHTLSSTLSVSHTYRGVVARIPMHACSRKQGSAACWAHAVCPGERRKRGVRESRDTHVPGGTL
jgi:hypothetical protein